MKKATEILDELIVETLVGIEQIIDCEEETKRILQMFNEKGFLQNLSSNIIVINGWIQEIQQKKK